MTYEMGHPRFDPANDGSRVAGNGKRGAFNVLTQRVTSRAAGTTSASRARRAATGLRGYGNLAGYDPGLGLSFRPLTNVIKAVAKPVLSFVPGGNAIMTGANILGGLKATNKKDQDRINDAMAKMNRALAGDATAYLQLQQGTGTIPGYGSATAIGKEAFKRALAYVDSQRAAPKPGIMNTPLVTPVSVPLVQQVQDAGLNINLQQKPGGGTQVVATNSSGAVVSSPLPIPTSAVSPDAAVLPVNAVSASGPAVTTRPTGGGIFSILDKLTQAVQGSTVASQNAQSQAAVSAAGGGGIPQVDTSAPGPAVADVASGGGGGGISPVILIAAGAAALLLSRRR